MADLGHMTKMAATPKHIEKKIKKSSSPEPVGFVDWLGQAFDIIFGKEAGIFITAEALLGFVFLNCFKAN